MKIKVIQSIRRSAEAYYRDETGGEELPAKKLEAEMNDIFASYLIVNGYDPKNYEQDL
jgi:hypothetical protein